MKYTYKTVRSVLGILVCILTVIGYIIIHDVLTISSIYTTGERHVTFRVTYNIKYYADRPSFIINTWVILILFMSILYAYTVYKPPYKI